MLKVVSRNRFGHGRIILVVNQRWVLLKLQDVSLTRYTRTLGEIFENISNYRDATAILPACMAISRHKSGSSMSSNLQNSKSEK